MAKVLPHTWGVPEKFRARVGAQAGKQRAMVHDGHLLLILHVLPQPGEIRRVHSLFWRSPDGAWKSGGAAKGGLSALRAHLESFGLAVAALEERVEHAAKAADYFEVLYAASPILRAARNLHKTLQEAREAVPDDAELITLRDQAYEIERTAEILHADAKHGLDFCVATRAEEQAGESHQIAVSSHRLNLIVALFLPVTALGSMFGMNFVHGFEHSYEPWLFWVVLTLAFVSGFIVRARLEAPRARAKA